VSAQAPLSTACAAGPVPISETSLTSSIEAPYDLASLASLYRVASFVALGLLLLAGAFAWQRARPVPLGDLRRVPRALR
jgi:hypothetical protein